MSFWTERNIAVGGSCIGIGNLVPTIGVVTGPLKEMVRCRADPVKGASILRTCTSARVRVTMTERTVVSLTHRSRASWRSQA